MSNSTFSSAVEVAKEKHFKNVEKRIQYGTAGFRSKSEELDFVMYRMGLMAVLRSRAKNSAHIGVMITASHNPECDNGIKLVDPMGEMLDTSWESLATDLVNVSDEDIPKVLNVIIEKHSIDMNKTANVVLARDTRPSSPPLAQAVTDGVKVLGGNIIDYGVMSTPQLHYMVRCINTNGDYGKATEDGYFDKLSAALIKLFQQVKAAGNYKNFVKFDGANGVGALKMKSFAKLISDFISFDICNDGSTGKLNHDCGADFVKVQQKSPEGMKIEPGVRCVSVDGDADRVVYYYMDAKNKFHLLDGDKIATLVAGYLQECISKTGLDLKLGLVQTAYANGSSTRYISETLKVPVACVPTGVKHLHHKALEYDVGVYFEANGHGTVIFSDESLKKIKDALNSEGLSAEKKDALEELSSLVDVINQTVGDAVSDMFLVEVILHARGWDCEEWDKTYSDLANRQLKVKVADRNVIKTTDAERKCSSPESLQPEIDTLIANYPKGRSFVRPSGTEDVVRVYAEAENQESADELASKVGKKVYELAGGVGGFP